MKIQFSIIFLFCYFKKIPSAYRYWLKAVFLGSEKSQYASPSFPHWIDQWSSMNNPDDCSVLSSRIHQRKWLYRHSVDRWLPACLCLYPCRCHFVVFVFFLVIYLCLSLSANDQWWFDRHWTDHQLPIPVILSQNGENTEIRDSHGSFLIFRYKNQRK